MSPDTASSEYETRDVILQFLSDDELAKVTTLEASHGLAVGDEFVDLDHPEQGVRRLQPTTRSTMSGILSRRDVRQETWAKICSRLREPLER